MPAELADVVGTQDGLETTDGHLTANTTGFHFAGTNVFMYRVDFPDGRYVIGAVSAISPPASRLPARRFRAR